MLIFLFTKIKWILLNIHNPLLRSAWLYGQFFLDKTADLVSGLQCNCYQIIFIHRMRRVAPVRRRCEPVRGRRASRAPNRARKPRRRSRGTARRPCSKCWPWGKQTSMSTAQCDNDHTMQHIAVMFICTLVVVEPGVWVIVVQRRNALPSAITSKAFTSCSSR